MELTTVTLCGIEQQGKFSLPETLCLFTKVSWQTPLPIPQAQRDTVLVFISVRAVFQIFIWMRSCSIYSSMTDLFYFGPIHVVRNDSISFFFPSSPPYMCQYTSKFPCQLICWLALLLILCLVYYEPCYIDVKLRLLLDILAFIKP